MSFEGNYEAYVIRKCYIRRWALKNLPGTMSFINATMKHVLYGNVTLEDGDL
jgi:hypothetical protein